MNSKYRRHAPTIGPAGGFTLLEILVAIFIFAIVITAVFGSFRAVFSSTNAVSADEAEYAAARTCLQRMARDLDAMYITRDTFYSKPKFNGTKDPYRVVGDTTDVAGSSFGRLRFASLAHLRLNQDPREGVCRIVYYVQRRADGSLVLRRSDHLYPFPDFEESEDDPILCDHILSLEFAYMDAKGDMNERWDSESADDEYATPQLIEIRMTVGQPSRPIPFTTRIALHVHREPTE
jgi:general secretion pathway protein J